jgi:hypothetical protein
MTTTPLLNSNSFSDIVESPAAWCHFEIISLRLPLTTGPLRAFSPMRFLESRRPAKNANAPHDTSLRVADDIMRRVHLPRLAVF